MKNKSQVLHNLTAFFLLSGFLLLSVKAQDADVTASSSESKSYTTSGIRHEVGAAAGFSTGFGPAYRILYKGVGAMVCFTPINTGSMELYSSGLTFFLTLNETQNTKFFLYQGNHYFSQVEYYEGYSSSGYLYNGTNTGSYYNNYQAPYTRKLMFWNNGFGFGIELFHKEQSTSPFGFLAMCGLASMRSFTRANFTAELGLFYKFPAKQ